MNSEEKAVELRECPFCGEVPKFEWPFKTVSCWNTKCGNRANAMLLKDWNTRAPVSQWISVDHKRPGVGSVLVTNGHSVWQYEHSGGRILSGVTHWQPLPPPPKPSAPHTFQIVMPGSDKPIEAK